MGKENKKIVLKILGIFVISRLLILFVGYLSSLAVAKGKWFSQSSSLLDLFYRWDSGWYMSIVERGYFCIPGKESSIGFFPLYPLLVKILSFVFVNAKLTGFIISNVALFLAAIYLYKLVRMDFNRNVAFKSVFYMLIFPTSFFFSIFYTEGLFLFLAIACFYYARKKQWLVASALGFFLSLTRSVGFLIIIPLIFEYLDIDFKNFKIDRKKIKKDVFYLLLIPAGLFSFMFYNYIKFRDALAFSHVQAAWSRKLSFISSTLMNTGSYTLFYKIIFYGFVIFALILIVYLVYSKIRISYIIYSLLFLLFYLSTVLLESMPRYISVLFPIYLGMSLLSKRDKFFEYLFTLFSIALLTLFTILFVNGYWFT